MRTLKPQWKFHNALTFSKLIIARKVVMFLNLSVSHSVHGREGMSGRPPGQTPHPPGQTPPPQADGYCSGRYASYWNVFLLLFKVHNAHEKQVALLSGYELGSGRKTL